MAENSQNEMIAEIDAISTQSYSYEIPKYLLWSLIIETLLTFSIFILYVLCLQNEAASRFDKKNAVNFITITQHVLERHNKPLPKSDSVTVRSDMAKALAVHNYLCVNIGDFTNVNDKNDNLRDVSVDTNEVTTLIGNIQKVPDEFKTDDVAAFFTNYKISSSIYSKYNVGQFVVLNNNIWNSLERPFEYSAICTGLALLATIGITLYDKNRKYVQFIKKNVEKQVIKTSKDINLSWVSAQNMLDAYHQRNLEQNNWTFRLSVVVMSIGFGIIFYGIHEAILLNTAAKAIKGVNDGSTLIAIVSTASGVIINLIGGTFLSIYNSTLKQAIDYTNSLQKTSTVGTSLAILKSIEDSNDGSNKDTIALLNDAKIAIAKQLISTSA